MIVKVNFNLGQDYIISNLYCNFFHYSLIRKGYHLPCGLENGSLQQFFGNFVSYCGAHKPIQSPFLDKKGKLKTGGIEMREECGCCTMELEDGTTKDFLWTPCCKYSFNYIERMW